MDTQAVYQQQLSLSRCSLATLPPELLALVFRFIESSSVDVSHFAKVCRGWRALAYAQQENLEATVRDVPSFQHLCCQLEHRPSLRSVSIRCSQPDECVNGSTLLSLTRCRQLENISILPLRSTAERETLTARAPFSFHDSTPDDSALPAASRIIMRACPQLHQFWSLLPEDSFWSRKMHLWLTCCRHLTANGLATAILLWSKLRRLRLCGYPVTDDVLGGMAANCRHMQTLQLTECRRLSATALYSLSRACRGLQEVTLCNTSVDDDALCCLASSCGQLKTIQFTDVNLVDWADAFEHAPSSLQHISLNSVRHMSIPAMRELLQSCSRLEALQIGACGYGSTTN